jgi:hypothetical protein
MEQEVGDISEETPSRLVGRRGKGSSTSTPWVRPQRLNFMEELAEKQRQMGRSSDTPGNFGCRPVTNPRVSTSANLVQSDPSNDIGQV